MKILGANRAARVRPFFYQRREIGFELVTFVFCIQQHHDSRRHIVMAVRPIDRHAERELPLRQREKIIHLDAEVFFERHDKFLAELAHELVVKWLHRRIIPKHHLRRSFVCGAEGIAIRHGEKAERVGGQKIFSRRDGGVEGKSKGQRYSERGEQKFFYSHKNIITAHGQSKCWFHSFICQDDEFKRGQSQE